MPRLNCLSPHESAIAPHFLALPDYESDRTSYELTVRASDGGLHADVTVTVNVTDVEEQSVVEDTVPEPLPSVSEPYYTGGDFSEDVSTTGRVAVGDTATGEIGISGDRDWFAVELVAGRTYIIDLRGRPTEDGTLRDPYLHGIHDAEGNLISGTTNDNGGEDSNSRLVLTATETGTHYIAAGANSGRGTYELEVTVDDFSASRETPGTVEVGGTATGEIEYEGDRDWFAVELTAGETYKVELLGARSIAGTLLDPYIRGIHDANGRLISDTTDYASGPNSNSEVLFTPDEDGTYYVAAGSYLSGIRDEEVGTYTLQVSIDDFRADVDTTGTVEVGGSVTGEIEAQADEDWFAVTLEAGRTYQIDMEGSSTDGGTLENPFLYAMRDANGSYLRHADGWLDVVSTADRDSGEGLNARVTFTPDEDATYYVVAGSGGHMHADDSHGRSLGTYTLSVEEVVDAI